MKASSIGHHSERKKEMRENLKKERSLKKKLFEWLENKAQKMRENPTEAERRLKILLEQSEVEFSFQYGIVYRKKEWDNGKFVLIFKGYIADFYIPEKRLIVEADGGYHDSEIQSMMDAIRDRRILNIFPLQILRLKNEKILKADFNLKEIISV